MTNREPILELSRTYLEQSLAPKDFIRRTYIPPSGKVLDANDGVNMIDAIRHVASQEDMPMSSNKVARNLAESFQIDSF